MATKDRKCCECSVKEMDKEYEELDKLNVELNDVLEKFK